MSLEIYDCTLREGEQAEGASFSFENRIKLCEELDNFGIDYIELGWPLASQEIADSFRVAVAKVKRAKIVAFGSTSINNDVEEDANLNSILDSGAKYACIFGKTSKEHVEKQLKLTKEENLKKIFNSVRFLKNNGLVVFYDAEHYFDSFKEDENYSIETLISAVSGGAERIILCDTNGGILPDEAAKIVKKTFERLKEKELCVKLGVHFHDDCGLALANTLACINYIEQIQGTINGIGERTGNLDFSEFLPVYIKKMSKNSEIKLKDMKKINEEAFRLAGIEIPEKRAFVGDNAFCHKGGVHIDAQVKGASYEHSNPEDFGNKRVVLMNTLGGRNSIVHIAEQFGYKLDKNNAIVKEKIEELFEELKEYESIGYRMGSLKAEQFLLIEKYFGKNDFLFEIKKWKIESEFEDSIEKSRFYVSCNIDGEIVEEKLDVNGGPIDAAFKTLKKILSKKYNLENFHLVDFHVSIARPNSEESAVRTRIDFYNSEEFSCVGVDKNILESGIEAIEKGLRYCISKNKGGENLKI